VACGGGGVALLGAPLAMRMPAAVCCIAWLLLCTAPYSAVDARKSKKAKAKAKAPTRVSRHPRGTVQEAFMVRQSHSLLQPDVSLLPQLEPARLRCQSRH
jgi:hypothetical protein